MNATEIESALRKFIEGIEDSGFVPTDLYIWFQVGFNTYEIHLEKNNENSNERIYYEFNPATNVLRKVFKNGDAYEERLYDGNTFSEILVKYGKANRKISQSPKIFFVPQ